MKKSSQSFWKSNKDEDLFDYLHEVKIATLVQINRDVYGYEKFKTLYKRIAKFEKLGFLTQSCHVAFPKQKLISLTRQGFDEFLGNGDERIIELKSDSIAHDLNLVDIRHRLLNADKVIDFFSENALQTWKKYSENTDLRPYVEARCDAALKAQFSNGDVLLAVEYEANRKYISRIDEVVAKYYNTNDIPAVLYICSDEQIVQEHIQAENRRFSKYDARIYYKTFENFVHDQTLAFKNRDGEVLRLGNKVGE